MPVETLARKDLPPHPPRSKVDGEPPITGKRLVLLAVASLLTAAAALAIGILLFGDFGSTEGRILATTALLAGYGLMTLPAAILRDQRRAAGLTGALVALAVAAASLTTVAVWTDEADVLGKAIGTVNGGLSWPCSRRRSRFAGASTMRASCACSLPLPRRSWSCLR